MAKWEHKVLTVTQDGTVMAVVEEDWQRVDNHGQVVVFTDRLKQLGADGWELVSAFPTESQTASLSALPMQGQRTVPKTLVLFVGNHEVWSVPITNCDQVSGAV